MLAVTQPCGVFCVPPLTPIHLRPGKWAAQPLILILNSQTSLLEKSPPALRAKLNLKPKHFSECLYSLNQHLNFSIPHLLPSLSHSLSLHTSKEAALNLVVGTCVCSHRQDVPVIAPLWMRSELQHSKTVCPGPL